MKNPAIELLEEISMRAEKEMLNGGLESENGTFRLRADTRIICGDYTVYEMPAFGFSRDIPAPEIANSVASKIALFKELCKIWKVA